MAIKEFIIGPQNYWEEGYFNGDYTLPNVSKTYLQCDIDNIKGGRVVTGEYFQDNYIDGTYWHNNSMKFEMSVDAMIVQEATVSLQGYYQEGYYQSSYFEQRGSIFVLAAELTRKGEIVDASGSWYSEMSTSTMAAKSVDVNTSMSAEFTQTAYGARDRDIDLFAFTEGQLTSAVNAIRDYELDADSAFDVATDYIRYRNNTVDADAEFSQIVINERSRATSMETQAAFSLSAAVNVITENTSTANSEFAQSVDWSLVRFFDAGVVVETAISATISHIHGADIVASGFAELTADADFIASAASSISAETNVLAVIGKQLQTSSTITSSTFLLADPYEYTPRSVYSQTTQPAFSFAGIDYSQSKFGAASLKIAPGDIPPYHPSAGWDSNYKGFPIYNGTDYRYISPGRTIVTTNGINFNSYANNLPTGSVGDISWTGTYYITAIASGSSGPTYAINTIWYSTDGINWSSHTVHDGSNSSYRTSFNKIQVRYFNGSYFLAVRYVNGIHILKSSTLTGTYTTLVYSSMSSGFTSTTNTWTSSYSDASRIVFAVSGLGATGRFAVVSTNGNSFSSLGSSSSTEDSIEYITYIGSDYYLCQNSNAAGTGSFVQSSAGNVTLSGNSIWIYYSNGNWFRKPSSYSNILQSASSIGSLSNKITFGNEKRIGVPLTISGNSYFPVDDITYISSNNYTSYTTQTITGVSGLQGGVIYENADFSSVKTVDFWHRISARNAGTIFQLSSDDNNNVITVSSKNDIVECRVDENDVGKYISGGSVSPNTWVHTRIVANGGTAALYVNGTRVATIARGDFINLGKLYLGTRFNVGSVSNTIWIDELLITDELLTDPSVTSFTVPTKAWKNTTQTDVLLHFDGSLVDDTLVEIIPSAFIGASVNLSATAGVAYDSYLADITSTSTLSAVISATVGSDIIVDGFASLGCDIDKLRNFDSAIASEFAVNAEINYIVDNAAEFVTAFAQHTDNARTRDFDSAFESISTQLSAVARLAGLFVDDLTESSLSVDPVVIRSAALTASAEFAEYLDAYRVRFNESAISSEFAVDADGVVRITSESSLTSEASVSTSGDRVRFGVADLASEFAVNASINILGKVESTLFNNASLTVNAVKITSATSTTASETTLSADSANSLTRDYVVNAAIYANLDASVKKTMYGYADLTAFYSELAVVVKQTATDIECNVVSTMSVVAVKITESNIPLNSLFTQTTAVKKYMVGEAGLPSQSTLTASGTASTDTTAYLSSISFELAISYKTGAGAVDCDVVATMSVDAKVIRSGVSNLSASSTQVANIRKILSATSTADSITSVSAQGSKAVYGEIHISSAMSFTAAVRELVIDEIVYVIPAEIWTYEIASETRQYNIGQETREYIIS